MTNAIEKIENGSAGRVIIPPYPPATKKTMYFIGVTTGESSIMEVFPYWSRLLEFGDVELKGINLALHDDPAKYREAVEFIRNDPLSLGALVTTHKIDLYNAAHDLFDVLGHDAKLMAEISSIYKHDGKLNGEARDAVTSGLAYERLLQPGHFTETGGEVFLIGAGGSSIALSSYIMKRAAEGKEHPRRIIISNRSKPRLEEMQRIHKELRKELGSRAQVEYRLTPDREDNDRILKELPPGSIVINGTGLGKDAPGSPLSDAAVFPESGIVWDFNYRGELLFLDQARRQADRRNLTIVDGWDYFIYGWTRVIADVFHVDIPTEGEDFERISEIASEAGKR